MLFGLYVHIKGNFPILDILALPEIPDLETNQK